MTNNELIDKIKEWLDEEVYEEYEPHWSEYDGLVVPYTGLTEYLQTLTKD